MMAHLAQLSRLDGSLPLPLAATCACDSEPTAFTPALGVGPCKARKQGGLLNLPGQPDILSSIISTSVALCCSREEI